MEIIVFMNHDVVTVSDLNGVDSGEGNGKPLDELFPGRF